MCAHGKDIDINELWDINDEKNRFQNIRCKDCNAITKLGKWLRRPHDMNNSIEKRLSYNNCLGKTKKGLII